MGKKIKKATVKKVKVTVKTCCTECADRRVLPIEAPKIPEKGYVIPSAKCRTPDCEGKIIVVSVFGK